MKINRYRMQTHEKNDYGRMINACFDQDVCELEARIEELEAENERLRTEIKEIGQAVDSLDKTSTDHIDRLRKRGVIK